MNVRGEGGEAGASPPGPADRRPEPSGPRPGRSSRSPAIFAEAGGLARALVTYAPRKSVLALLLLLAAGVTEAFGLLMIIPLLHVVGFAARHGEESPVAEAVARAADAAGVELTLPAVLAVFLVLAAVRSAVAWQRAVLLAGMRLGFTDRLRERLYAAVAEAKWEFLLGRRRSDVQHVLTGDVNRIGQGAFLLLQLAVTALLALAQIVLAVLISPSLTAATLATGAALLFLTRSLMRRSRTLGEMLTGANRALYGSMTDFLGGLKLAKGYNAEGRHVRHFIETVTVMRERQLAFTRISSAARAGLDMGAAFALAALVWFALSTAALPLPELLLMTVIFARLLPALFRLQQHAQALAHALPAYAHARAMYRALKEAAETPAGRGGPRMELRSALTVRDVSFTYEAGAESGTGAEAWPDRGTATEPGSEAGTGTGVKDWPGRGTATESGSEAGTGVKDWLGRGTAAEPGSEAGAGAAAGFGMGTGAAGPALKNVSLDVPAGKMTAIAGPSGAGKSTLADVLLGLLAPGEGEVCVDGVPLAGPDLHRWRRSVACVPQDPYLFHDTIRANLRWAQPGATEAEMWQALRLAAADGFVAALPDGLDTVTGDRGGRLSGGERQRIALARALMRRPALLVLDEATGQLDAENERRILDALESLRGRTTVVAIAHSPALLEAADGIVRLESGRVAATGAWRELAAGIMAIGGGDERTHVEMKGRRSGQGDESLESGVSASATVSRSA